MNKVKKSFLITMLIVLTPFAMFAHGKGDVEDIPVALITKNR